MARVQTHSSSGRYGLMGIPHQVLYTRSRIFWFYTQMRIVNDALSLSGQCRWEMLVLDAVHQATCILAAESAVLLVMEGDTVPRTLIAE